MAANEGGPDVEASWHGDTQQSSECWRQHTFLILTSLVREPSRWLAFFSNHFIRLLTPPSAFDEALLFSQPVILRSTNPALGAVVRVPFMDTSLAAACLMMALLAFALRIPALPLRPPRDVESRALGGGVAFPILPLPLTAISIFTSPSRSPLRIPPPRRPAAGPRGAFRGLWLRADMVAAGMLDCRQNSAGIRDGCDDRCGSCVARSERVGGPRMMCCERMLGSSAMFACLIARSAEVVCQRKVAIKSWRCLCQGRDCDRSVRW